MAPVFLGAVLVVLIQVGRSEPSWHPASWAGAFGLYLVSGIWHELGHVSALKRFGYRPGSIGMGMYLFFPVFYSDVRRAWHLEPRQRLVVDIGGIYFHILFAGACAGAWLVTGGEVWGRTLVLICVAMAMNFNPFFRMDGYWVASDLMQINNLRGEAVNLWSGRTLRSQTSPWLRVYAVSSFVYFAGVLGFLTLRALPKLVESLLDSGSVLAGGGVSAKEVLSFVVGLLVLAGAAVILGRGVRSLLRVWKSRRR